jgi:phage gp29-like protein
MAKEPVKGRGKNFPVKGDFYSRANSVDAFNSVDVLPNPDPVLSNINNTWSNYQEILWDAHLTAVIASRKSVTLSKEWYIEKNGAPARVVKFIEEAFTKFDVHRATEEILDSMLWGMQPMEPIWARPENFDGEGKIFCIEFIGRPPWWFQYDRENKLRFRSRENPWPGNEIKPYSLVVPRNNPKYENPYGEALLSKVYWPVNFKKGTLKFWVEGAERNGLPLIIGKVNRNAGDEEYDALYEKLLEYSKGTTIVGPDGMAIEVIDLKGKSSADVYKMLCDFCNAEVSKAIIGQTLTTEAGDKGARALGQVHDNVRHDLAESDEIQCEGCFNELIRMLVDLNFGNTTIQPLFKYQHEEDIRQDVAERDNMLVSMGVRFTPKYYQEQYNLAEDDFTVTEPTEQNPKSAKKEDEDDFNERQFAEILKSNFKDQAAVDAFMNNLSDEELQKQAEFVKPIVKLANEAESFDEFNEGMIKIFAKLRPEKLEKNLGRAMFNTENAGISGND